jgi:hypothetical protein
MNLIRIVLIFIDTIETTSPVSIILDGFTLESVRSFQALVFDNYCFKISGINNSYGIKLEYQLFNISIDFVDMIFIAMLSEF